MLTAFTLELGGGFIVLGVLATAGVLRVRSSTGNLPALAVLAPIAFPLLALAWAAAFFGSLSPNNRHPSTALIQVGFLALLAAPGPLALVIAVRSRRQSEWWPLAVTGGLAVLLSLLVWFIGTMGLHDDWL